MLANNVLERLKQLKIFQLSSHPDAEINISLIQEHLAVVISLYKEITTIKQYEAYPEEPRSKNYERILRQLLSGIATMKGKSPIKDAIEDLKQYVIKNRDAYMAGQSIESHPAVKEEAADLAKLAEANRILENDNQAQLLRSPQSGDKHIRIQSNSNDHTALVNRPNSDMKVRPHTKLVTHSDTTARLFRPKPNRGLISSDQGIALDLSEDDFLVVGKKQTK